MLKAAFDKKFTFDIYYSHVISKYS